MKLAKSLEMSWFPSGLLSQCFGLNGKRNPTQLVIPSVGSLSGAVNSSSRGGHLTASKRRQDGEKEPEKWAEDEGFARTPSKSYIMETFAILCLVVIILLLS